MLVNLFYQRLRKVPAPDAGLTGHDNDWPSRFVQFSNCRADAAQHTESADVIQVADFVRDGSLAIRENSRAQR